MTMTLVGAGGAMTGLGSSILTTGGLGTSGSLTTVILGSCTSTLGTICRIGLGGGGTNLGLTGSAGFGTGWKVTLASRFVFSIIFAFAAVMTMRMSVTTTLSIIDAKTDGVRWRAAAC